MSKKIIYLLSLLMVLSLLFASCKKDGNQGITGGGGGSENQEEDIKNDTGGVVDNWEDLQEYNEKPIQDYAVIDVSKSGSDYYRNPVVVALGGNNVLIITEKRIGFEGSENDVGVDGQNRTDLVYLLSTDAGDSFSEAQTVGSPSTGGNDAVCSPVVYYQKPFGNTAKIHIIASSGAGLSRTDTPYASRTIKSKLRYISGEVKDLNVKATITWGQWKDLTWSLTYSVNEQFGIQSARGVIADDGDLILPVMYTSERTKGLGTISDPAQRLSGWIFKIDANNVSYVGTANELCNSGFQYSINGVQNTNFAKHMASVAISYTSTEETVDLLEIPSERAWYSMSWYRIKGSIPNANGNPPGNSGGGAQVLILSGEGSFGFLKLTGTWYGTGGYDPKKYATSPTTAGTAPSSINLLSYAYSKCGLGLLTSYDIDKHLAGLVDIGGQIAKTSKSSSIDVLSDGTIIMATEKERDPNADGNKFSIFFSRYTQKYIANKMK